MLKREGVMLAYPLDKRKVSRLGNSFFVQPKFKGERCRIEWFHEEPVLLSSYGNEFKFLSHITEALKKLNRKLPFDGEIYKHGWSQGRINSAANRKVKRNEDSEQLEFHIFDTQENGVQSERFNFLELKLSWPLITAETILIQSFRWQHYAQKYISQGYEGIILRSTTGLYSTKRSTSLLKFKPTEVDEYIIFEVLEAVDKNGEKKNTLGAFLVKAKDEETTFKVGAGKLKHSEREEFWKRRETLIGKTIEVKHELTKTERGIPDCAVAVKILD